MMIRKLVAFLSNECSLEYFNYNDGKACLLPSSVMLKAEIRGVKYRSWGVGESEDVAYFKALMELVERSAVGSLCPLKYKKQSLFSKSYSLNEISEKFSIPIFNLHPTNSNGAGIGLSKKFAIESAKMELIERHTILTALVFGVSPQKTDFNLFPFKLPTGYKLMTYFWEVQGIFVTLMVMIHPSGGMYFGTAARRSLKLSLTKAFEELTPSILFSINEQVRDDFQIEAGDLTSFSRYWRFSGDDRLLRFLNIHQLESNHQIRLPRDYFFSPIPIPVFYKELRRNFHCVRVISPDAQQLFFDNWKIEYLNPKIFNNDQRLPSFPHIIA